MRLTQILLVGCLVLTTSACSHLVASDYPKYLSNNTGTADFPATNKAREYSLTPETQQHSYEFRSFTTGAAQLWVVEFGKMLDATLQSADVQGAFGVLGKVTPDKNDSNMLIFDLKDYSFEDFGAHIALDVSLVSDGKLVFTKSYTEDGKTQGSKMFWGGALAQKNAVQQSTKLALDNILRDLITDMNMQRPES
jgi:hypothetical protein